jgi:signal transduction histidine kinase
VVSSFQTAPALAEAADILSGQFKVHLQDLAKRLRVRAGGLERRFAARLRELGFDRRQRKALQAVTPGAAARLLARRKPLAAFFEQVEYNGRRLAKLEVSPGAILRALGEYDRLLRTKLSRLAPNQHANLQWAREQLGFCVVLTLNNAFYQVREAETQAFFELAQAELESGSPAELLERSLDILRRFSRAEAARLFLLDGAAPAAPASRLAKVRFIRKGASAERLLLEPGWRGRYPCCWSIPLRAGGGLAGVLQFAFAKVYEWLPRELRLLSAAGERFLLAAEKARLMEDLAAREEQVRGLAEHMLQVEENERRRIGGELHDEAGQMLLYLRLKLELLERLAQEGRTELKVGLAEARQLVEQSIVEIRRLLADLSPAVLEQLGLAAALRQLVNRLRRLHPAQIRLRTSRLGALAKHTERVAYRLVQECCSNIARHSAARDVNISLTTADGVLKLCVRDNGVGFSVAEALGKPESFGLAGLRERVLLLGGKCHIHSRPGQGTVVSLELPVPPCSRPGGP